jgi:hypothetical protein
VCVIIVSIQRHAPTNTDVSVVRATKHQSCIVIIYVYRMIAVSFMRPLHVLNLILLHISPIKFLALHEVKNRNTECSRNVVGFQASTLTGPHIP